METESGIDKEMRISNKQKTLNARVAQNVGLSVTIVTLL